MSIPLSSLNLRKALCLEDREVLVGQYPLNYLCLLLVRWHLRDLPSLEHLDRLVHLSDRLVHVDQHVPINQFRDISINYKAIVLILT